MRQRQRIALAESLRRAQSERLNALSLLDAVVDGSIDAIYAKDREGRYLLFNRAAAAFVGKAPEQVVGRDDAAIFASAEAALVRASDQRATASERVVTYQEHRTTRDGERTFLTTKGPLRDAQGEPVGIFGISRDITEIDRVARDLAQETARRRMLVEGSRDGIIIIDHEHRITEANRRFAEMLGYPIEEVIGLRTWEYEARLTEEDVRRNFSDFRQLHGIFESRHRRKDGSEYDVEVGVSGTDWGDHQAVLCVCRDISERKRAERLLRETNELLGEMSAIAHIGAWEFDQRTGKGTWTAEVARIHGIDPDLEPTADLGLSFFHGEHRARLEAALRAAREEGCGYDLELQLVTATGAEKWVRTIGKPVLDEQGRVVGLRGSIQDVTELKRASDEVARYRQHLEELVSTRTAELRRQSQALRAIIDNIPLMIWLKDREGRFLAVNRTKAEICGRSVKALIGQTSFDIWPRELAQGFRDDDEEVMRTRRQKTVEEIIPCEPPTLYETFKAPVLDDDGTVFGTVGFSRDISAQRETERIRESARQAAEAANRAKSAFLANMSHEIRTPMNAIVGLAYLLRQSGVTPDQAGRLNKIESAAQHLLSIVNDILDLSKIESGRMEVEQTDFSLMAILDQVQSLIADQARSKGLRVEVDPDAVPRWLRGDPDPPASGAAELRGECGQVHRAGDHPPACLLTEGGGRRFAGSVRGRGYRGRYQPGDAASPLSTFRSGGCLDHPQARRHRPGVGHHAPVGRTHGRRGRRRE